MSDSRTTPYNISTNDYRFANTSDADDLPCRYCHTPIVLLEETMPNGKIITNRANRIDCQDEDHFESYHLACYDRALFGRVLVRTQKKVRRLREKYGAI